MIRSVAQSGRAPLLGRGGRRFESCRSDLNMDKFIKSFDFYLREKGYVFSVDYLYRLFMFSDNSTRLYVYFKDGMLEFKHFKSMTYYVDISLLNELKIDMNAPNFLELVENTINDFGWMPKADVL